MATYNRAFCIQNAIDSLLKQTYQDFELIIVDDGSTDDTEKLIKEKYAKELHTKKIIYKKLKQNKGVCNARNVGLKSAHNSWIGYLDSDNEMLPDFLETFQTSIIENPKNKIFYSQLQRTNGQVIGQPFIYEQLQKANFIDLGVFVHNKSLILKYGKFDTNLRRLVDWDLILRYTKKEKPIFIEKVLLKYSNEDNYKRISNSESYEIAKSKISNKQYSLFQKIFSIKNENNHKVLRILGVKVKFKRGV